VGLALMSTIVGMAFGGWLSGAIFDLTGSYAQAFSNGIAWNLLNISIVGFLMLRQAGRRQIAAAPEAAALSPAGLAPPAPSGSALADLDRHGRSRGTLGAAER
jgi:hypothetical protein